MYHYNSLPSENFGFILQMAEEGQKQLSINNQGGAMQYSTDKQFYLPLVYKCLRDHSLLPSKLSDVVMSIALYITSAYKY